MPISSRASCFRSAMRLMKTPPLDIDWRWRRRRRGSVTPPGDTTPAPGKECTDPFRGGDSVPSSGPGACMLPIDVKYVIATLPASAYALLAVRIAAAAAEPAAGALRGRTDCGDKTLTATEGSAAPAPACAAAPTRAGSSSSASKSRVVTRRASGWRPPTPVRAPNMKPPPSRFTGACFHKSRYSSRDSLSRTSASSAAVVGGFGVAESASSASKIGLMRSNNLRTRRTCANGSAADSAAATGTQLTHQTVSVLMSSSLASPTTAIAVAPTAMKAAVPLIAARKQFIVVT
mmetsp:Transcript_2651/g.9270  ORF Transcript_2651/g.9270 Transcript_2651/m.9270 type:complete len:290 (-) Transcript_2651:981-1850(-)